MAGLIWSGISPQKSKRLRRMKVFQKLQELVPSVAILKQKVGTLRVSFYGSVDDAFKR